MSKVLAAEARAKISKGINNQLRRDGRIPAVVYGNGEPLHIHVGYHDFSTKFKKISESEIISLELGKAKRNVLIKDYQKNHLRNEVIHIDFLEVTKDHILKTHVPLHVSALSAAIRASGGILENSLHEVEIECLPGDIPEAIEVDASTLAAGHALHIRDIKAPKGVKILNNPDQVIATLTHVKAEAAPAAETPAAT